MASYRSTSARRRVRVLASAAVVCVGGVLIGAENAGATVNTYTWLAGAAGNWNTLADWSPTVTGNGPTGAGNIVQQTSSTGTNGTNPDTTLTTSGITIGQIKNTPSSGRIWTILDDSNHYAITMDNTGGTTNLLGTIDSAITSSSSGGVVFDPSIIIANTSLDIGALSSGAIVIGNNVANTNSITAKPSSTVGLKFQSSGAATTTVYSSIGGSDGFINIYNGGTGAGATSLLGTLGAEVASITQNSSTSTLTIAGSNVNYGGTTYILNGTLSATTATATSFGSVIIGTSTTNGTLSLNGPAGAAYTVKGLATGTGATVASQTITNVGGATATLIFTSGTTEFDGTITNAASKPLSLNISSGTLSLYGAGNSYTGLTTINGGTLNINSEYALGGAVYTGLTFGSAGGTLMYKSTPLNTTTDVTANSGGTAEPVTLTGTATINTNGNTINFANSFGNSGSGGLIKTGAGTLILAGSTTYTGNTNVSTGTLSLALPGSTNNIALSPVISVGSGATLSVTGLSGAAMTLGSGKILNGTGSVNGTVIAASGSILEPGTVTAGIAGSGILTIGTLNLSSGSNVNFGLIAGNTTNNYISASSLNLPSSGTVTLNLYSPGTSTPFGAAGTYDLFGYSTPISTGYYPFTIAPIPGYSTTFNDTGSFVQLIVTAAGNSSNWSNGASTGNWSNAGNWSNGIVPHLVQDTANFLTAAPGTVNLDANETVGAIAFNNTNAFTISTNDASVLTLDNNAGGATISVAAGSHSITAPISLNDNLTVAPVASASVAISGGITQTGSARSLSVIGFGTLALNGVDSYTGGTTITNGVLNFTAGSLGTGGVTFNNGTLQYASGNTDDVSAQTVTLTGNATIDTGANAVVFANAIGNGGGGGLTKAGTGTLQLATGNTYTGANTISAGTLEVMGDTSLGAVPASAGTNLTLAAGTTLQFGAAVTMVANRNVLLSSGINTFDTNTFNDTINGALTSSSSSLFNKISAGILTLGGATNSTSATGGITINGGTVAGATSTYLPSGTVTLNNSGGIALTSISNVASGFGPVVVNGTNFITGATSTAIFTLGQVLGSGSLTFGGGYVNDLGGDLTSFTGTLSTYGGSYRFNGTTGGTGLTLNLGALSVSERAGGTPTITIGQLLGTAGSYLTGSGGSGNTIAVTYNIGAKTVSGSPVNSTYAGIIGDGAGYTYIVKSGLSTLSLSGADTYSGTTTVGAGVLSISNSAGLGTTTNGTSVTSGATLQLLNNISVGAEALTLNGSGASGQTGALVNVSGNNTYGGAINVATSSTISAASGSTLNLTGGVVKSGTVATFNGGGTINVSTAGISGSAANSDLIVTGSGTTLNIGAASTYNGPTTVQSSGAIVAAVDNALPTTSALTVNSSGTYDMASHVQTVASLTGDATGTVKNSTVSTTSTLTLNNSSGIITYAGTIAGTNSGAQGDINLNKTGAGTQVLSGANTYTGTTHVTGGTLLVNGSIAAGSTVTVGDGSNPGSGTLAGTGGNIAGPVTIQSGGTITAGTGATTGDSVGTLNTAAVTLGDAGSFYVKVDGNVTPGAAGTGAGAGANSADELVISGLVSFGTLGTFTIKPNLIHGSTELTPGNAYSWIIADATTSTTAFDSMLASLNSNMQTYLSSNAFGVPGTLSLSKQLDSGGQGEDLVLTDDDTSSSPEPTSMLLLATVAAPLLLGRRRRKIAEHDAMGEI